jgi:hypothetical protein
VSAPDPALVAAALRMIHHWARGRRVVVEPRALDTAEALGFDPDDIMAALLATDPTCVRSMSPDHAFSHRTVLEMQVLMMDTLLYVKVSLCIEIDHNVKVLSFKRWGS